jgi:hypothetical protein
MLSSVVSTRAVAARGRRLPSWTRTRLDASLIIIQIMMERCRAGKCCPRFISFMWG